MKELNMENANDHPFKVSIVKDAEFFANSHPYKVTIEGGGGNEGRVVDELPEEGEPGYIYLVLKEHTPEGDIYDEYMWVLQQDGETYGWEHIGATNEIRLGSIYTLTTADYNWNRAADSQTEPYDCVAVWLLESGVYTTDEEVTFCPIKGASIHGANTIILHTKSTGQPLGYGKTMVFNGQQGYFYEGVNGGVAAFSRTLVNPFIEQTTGNDTQRLMSQKAITDAINNSIGGIRELTVDDYDYPVNNPSQIAAWLLEPGVYSAPEGVRVSGDNSAMSNISQGVTLIIGDADGQGNKVITMVPTHPDDSLFPGAVRTEIVNSNTGAFTSSSNFLGDKNVIDNLTTTSTWQPLSAKQGKVLNDKIGQIETVLQTLTIGNGV